MPHVTTHGFSFWAERSGGSCCSQNQCSCPGKADPAAVYSNSDGCSSCTLWREGERERGREREREGGREGESECENYTHLLGPLNKVWHIGY